MVLLLILCQRQGTTARRVAALLEMSFSHPFRRITGSRMCRDLSLAANKGLFNLVNIQQKISIFKCIILLRMVLREEFVRLNY